MERKAAYSIHLRHQIKVFLPSSKECTALKYAGSHFPKFLWQLSLFSSKKSSFSHGFQA